MLIKQNDYCLCDVCWCSGKFPSMTQAIRKCDNCDNKDIIYYHNYCFQLIEEHQNYKEDIYVCKTCVKKENNNQNFIKNKKVDYFINWKLILICILITSILVLQFSLQSQYEFVFYNYLFIAESLFFINLISKYLII
jgi:hypothetical protein